MVALNSADWTLVDKQAALKAAFQDVQQEQLIGRELIKVYLIEDYIEAGKFREASQIINEVLSSFHQMSAKLGDCSESYIRNHARILYLRGEEKEQERDYKRAFMYYEAAVRLNSGYTPALNRLALLQAIYPSADFHDPNQAVENALKACRCTDWQDHLCLGTLAVCCSENCNFPAAVKWQEKAIDSLDKNDWTAWISLYQARLNFYKSNRPYHSAMPGGFLTTGLVAWYKMDEIDENHVFDASANRIHGKLHGNASIVTDGIKGKVLNHKDNTGFVDCGDNPLFNITGPITIACWLKVDAFDKWYQYIITKGNSSWRICRYADTNRLHFACNGVEFLDGNIDINDGQWHHIAGVYDGKKIYLYVDGRLDIFDYGSGKIDTNNCPVYIGANAECPNEKWNGLIDDVRIYHRALTPEEITALYDTDENSNPESF